MWASLVRSVLPGPSLEVSHSSLAAATPPTLSPPLGVGVRVPQVPHITPQLRPPVQPKARQHAASWPPVDAGRLNVTHIIIHHRGELGKEGRDGELVCERGGGQGRTLLSRAAKIPPAPPLNLFNIPNPDQKPSTLPQQWWIKTSTRMACSSCSRGASERQGNMDKRWRIEGTRPLFSVFISLDCAALHYWVWVATLFTCIWKDVMAVWRTPTSLLVLGLSGNRKLEQMLGRPRVPLGP